MTAAIALEFSLSVKPAETAGATLWALEAIWPAPGEQGVLTLLFTAITSQKLHNAKAFLEPGLTHAYSHSHLGNQDTNRNVSDYTSSLLGL